METNSQHLNVVSSFRCDRMVQSRERWTTNQGINRHDDATTIAHLFRAVRFTGYLQTSSSGPFLTFESFFKNQKLSGWYFAYLNFFFFKFWRRLCWLWFLSPLSKSKRLRLREVKQLCICHRPRFFWL